MPLSESDMEEIRRVATRLFSSVVADGGVAPRLQDGDRVTVEIEELFYKDGTLPASKAAIAALPEVTITETEDQGSVECSICLTEYFAGQVVKEMPCKHRYHLGCIGKWLAIRGSCPFCRYEMFDTDDNDDEEIMVVNVYVQRANQNDSDNGAPDHDDSGDSLMDSREDMEIDYNGSSMEDVD